MKKFLLLVSTAGLLGAVIGGCQKPASTADNEKEIERRVQERLAEERRADQQKQLDQREAALRQKEQDLAAQQQALDAQRMQSSPPAEATDSTPAADDSTDEDAPPTVATASFYDALSPYGTWLQVPGISGYVWQPFVARQDARWRPYQHGHWAYSDQGWAWISDEPFGWATYHYGRWEQLEDTGWVWMPGDEWAPAWVSWRSNDDYIGWAPLPPDNGTVIAYDNGYDYGAANYCFVPAASFCEPAIVNYIVEPQYNTVIINKTVIISKVVKIQKGRHVKISNPGPPPNFVQGKTKKPVNPLKIMPAMGQGAIVQKGNGIQVVAPATPASGAAVQRPANVQQITKPARRPQPPRPQTAEQVAPQPPATNRQFPQNPQREQSSPRPPQPNAVQSPLYPNAAQTSPAQPTQNRPNAGTDQGERMRIQQQQQAQQAREQQQLREQQAQRQQALELQRQQQQVAAEAEQQRAQQRLENQQRREQQAEQAAQAAREQQAAHAEEARQRQQAAAQPQSTASSSQPEGRSGKGGRKDQGD